MRFALRAIEQAIHHALQKIDTTDPAMRNKVYQAAWQAYEKKLASTTQATAAEKQQRRENLKQIIHSIEAQFREALPQNKEPSPPQSNTPDPILVAPSRFDNGVDARRNKEGETLVEKRSFLRGNGFLLVLVGILLFVAWSFYHALIEADSPRLTDNPSTSAEISALIAQEQSTGNETSQQAPIQTASMTRKWINIFDPADISTIQVKGTARVQLHEDENGRFIRLNAKTFEDRIVLEMGAGLIPPLQSGNAIFNMIARSATGQIAQLSVACDIGTAATCGRWRFELPSSVEDLLFGVDNLQSVGVDSPVTFTLTVGNDAFSAGGDEMQVDIFGLEVSFDD